MEEATSGSQTVSTSSAVCRLAVHFVQLGFLTLPRLTFHSGLWAQVSWSGGHKVLVVESGWVGVERERVGAPQ